MQPAPSVDPIEVLLVADDEGDARVGKEAFKEGKVANVLHHVTDGGQARAFLRRQNAPRPDLIFLDRNGRAKTAARS